MKTDPQSTARSVPASAGLALVSPSLSAKLHPRAKFLLAASTGAAVCAALLLRWSGVAAQSLWLDEGYSLWISNFSPANIWHVLPLDTSSPLYYILLHFWTAGFGDSEFALRTLSALFATLSIPLFYLLARKILADPTAVALALALYAFSFFQIWYAQEARCYALLVLLSLGTVYSALLALEGRTLLRSCSLIFFLTASLYTHNVALFYLPGLALLWLLYPAQASLRARLKSGTLITATVVILYLPWWPVLHQQLRRVHRGFWVPVPKVADLLDSLCILAGLDTRTFQTIFRNWFNAQRLFGFWTWAPLIVLVILLCIAGALYSVSPVQRRKIIALAAYTLAPVFLVFIDSRISNSIYINRVFLGSCVLLPLLLCAPVAFRTGRSRTAYQWLCIVILIGTAVSANGYLRRESREDWRGLCAYLTALPEQRRLVVIVPDTAQPLVQYYASRSRLTSPLQITGPVTRYQAPDLALEERALQGIEGSVDVTTSLTHAVSSGDYREIDIGMQSGRLPGLVLPTLQYLAQHCDSIQVVKFHNLELRRCLLSAK